MPNYGTHAFIGTTSGGVASLALAVHARSPHPILEAFAGVIGGWVGGVLPDFLEPSKSGGPNHRGFAHGILSAGSGLTVSIITVRTWQDWFRQKAAFYQARAETEGGHFGWLAIAFHLLAGFLAGVVAGYTSHLIADRRTPKGLPLY